MKKIHALFFRFCNWFRLIGKHRHHYHIKQSKTVIIKLRSMRKDGVDQIRIMNYLRKIHPSTFEELILNLAESSGAVISRNSRYTGDGGVDGIFRFNGEKWIVQAKRYSSAINPKHVDAFVTLIRRRKTRGLFVHTGKTGNMSKEASKNGDVWFLSGPGLVRVVCGEKSIFTEVLQYN